MMWAIDGNENKICADKNIPCLCPTCRMPVSAVIGQGKMNSPINHWRHEKSADCDDWAEGETDWHVYWKNMFPKKYQEVTSSRPYSEKKRRADVCFTEYNYALEFQYSPMSFDEVRSRESWYGFMMAWLFDATDAYDEDRLEINKYTGEASWFNPKRHWQFTEKDTYLDTGSFIISKKMITEKEKTYNDRTVIHFVGDIYSYDEWIKRVTPPPMPTLDEVKVIMKSRRN